MSRTATIRWVLAALVALAVGWALAPHGAPPVYDGLGFPDEPYRFVAHVDGSTATKRPTTATASAPVTRGVAGAISANTAEQAPQLSLLIPVGRLQPPSGTTRVTVSAAPAAPIDPPAGGHLWSNVYVVTASPAGVGFVDKNPTATLTLRAGDAQRPRPRVERYVGGRWVALKTYPVGRDIYSAGFPALGTYAVVGTEPLDLAANGSGTSSTSSASDGTNATGIVIAAAAGAVVVALVVVAVVRRRRRSVS